MAKFDWYQASPEANVRDVLAAVAERFPGDWEDCRKAPNGYQFGRRRVDPDGVVCQVWWGDRHEFPHALFTGETAPDGAALLRQEFPRHRVARTDSCIDYAQVGAYDSLQYLLLGVARDKGIKVGTAGDHLLTKEGRSLYLGSSASTTRLRLYDKSAELRHKFQHDPVRLAAVPANLARLEVQTRPATLQAKLAAAYAEPLALMASSAWTQEVMRQVEGVDLPRFQAGKVWRQSDDARAYATLLQQYGGLLRRMLAELGSAECLGLQLAHDLAEREKAKRRH